ncbi:MAG: hypothetical protein JXR73_21655 [Candidatus Omnitrophica bacterium]|nr:hypothetical protein [Candidatus Omnitrophota bacterium]
MNYLIVFIALFSFLLSCPAVQYAEDGKTLNHKNRINYNRTSFSKSNLPEQQKNHLKRRKNISELKKNARLRYKRMLPADGGNPNYKDRFGFVFSPELTDVTKFIAAPWENLMKKENQSTRILEKFPIQTVKPDPNIHYTMRYAHGEMNGTILERKALPHELGNADSNPDLLFPFNIDINSKKGMDISPFDTHSKKRSIPKTKPE